MLEYRDLGVHLQDIDPICIKKLGCVHANALATLLYCGCRGLVEYAAPLCYLFADQASCAVLFCSMYARFWCRLHTIDDTAGKHATLVSLCVLFVRLLEVCCQMDQT